MIDRKKKRIAIPGDLLGTFKAVRHTMDLCPAHAGQAVVADFIREGHFSRHVRRMRLVYRERRNVLVDAIDEEFHSKLTMLG